MRLCIHPMLLATLIGVPASALAGNPGCPPPGPAPCPAPCPAVECYEAKCAKVCVPKEEKKKVSVPYYECKCEDFCLPKCRFSFSFPKMKKGCPKCCEPSCPAPAECKAGGCAECEKPRTRKVLIKKLKSEEVDVVTCKVEERVEMCPVKHKKCKDACAPPRVVVPHTKVEGIAPPVKK